MARSVSTIQQAMLNDVAANSTLASALTSPSATAIWRLLIYITAVCVNLFEQALDLYRANNDASLLMAPSGTTAWLRNKIFQFQTGYVLQFNTTTFVIDYATTDPSAQIITFCSVKNSYSLNSFFGGNGLVIRAATGTTPTALSGAQLTELQNYVASIVQPGILVDVSTGSADLIRIICEVRYDARYTSVIQANVFASINNYIQHLEDLDLSVDRVFQAIEQTEGVKAVVMELVSARDAATAFGSSTIVFSSIPSTSVPAGAVQFWATKFGYMIQETTGGETWADTITFTPVTT